MTACPRCKSESAEVVKSWDVIPKSGRGKPMRVTLYLCNTCGYKYRKATKIEVQPTVQPLTPAEEPKIQQEQQPSVVDEVLKLMVVKETSLKSNGESEIASKLFEYIKSHEGLLNIKQCSMELEVDPGKVKEVLEKLLDEGSIVKMEEGESPAKTIEELTTPPTPEIQQEEQPQKLSIFQRIKRAFTG
jgi:hypothetical protein